MGAGGATFSKFLQEFSDDIRGACLEFQEDHYASRFGGSRVASLDILDRDGNRHSTIVVDLTKSGERDIPSQAFNCIICTHVLHFILDVDKAISELYRILKLEGVLLVGVPSVSMAGERHPELWRFTGAGLHRLLTAVFRPEDVQVLTYGNSLTAAGEMRGLVSREFTRAELEYYDPDFAVEVCARAVKRPC